EEHGNRVTIDGMTVYVADSGNSSYGDTPPRVQSIPLGGGSFTDLFVGTLPGFSPQGIAVQGSTLYLTSGNQILQMPTTGGTPTVFATDPRFGNLTGLTFFNSALYVVDNHAGFAEVWKVGFAAATSTSISAPTVTYGSNGVVTVMVASPSGTPTGN